MEIANCTESKREKTSMHEAETSNDSASMRRHERREALDFEINKVMTIIMAQLVKLTTHALEFEWASLHTREALFEFPFGG